MKIMLEIMAHTVLRKEEFQRSIIIVDETTDVSNIEQLVFSAFDMLMMIELNSHKISLVFIVWKQLQLSLLSVVRDSHRTCDVSH